MTSIINALDNLFQIKKERNWDRTFWAFDIHGTLIKPNYSSDEIPTEMYEYAVEVLQLLTEDPEVSLILYTCSHPHEIEKYLEYFEGLGIGFNHVNENPEVKTDLGGYGCYDKKPYFNILFEDKAGFNPEFDWGLTLSYLLDRDKKREKREELNNMITELANINKKK